MAVIGDLWRQRRGANKTVASGSPTRSPAAPLPVMMPLLIGVLGFLPSAMAQAGQDDFVQEIFGEELLTGNVARASPVNPGQFINTGGLSETAAALSLRAWGVDLRVRADTVFSLTGDADPSTRVVLQELSRDFRLDDSTILSIGKRNLSWDVSSTFLPLGFFAKTPDFTDLTDANRRAEGLPLISLTRSFGPYSLTAVYSDDFGTKPNGFNRGLQQWAVRAAADLKGISVAAVAQQPFDQPIAFGGSLTGTIGDDLSLYAEGLVRSGTRRPVEQGVAGAPFDFSASEAYGSYFLHSGGLRPRLVVGGLWSLSSSTTITAELIHDGDGLSASEFGRFRDLVRFHQTGTGPAAFNALLSDGATLLSTGARRDYASLRIAYGSGAWSGGLLLVGGLADGALQSNAQVAYAVTDATSLALSYTYIGGAAGSEFALSPVTSVLQFALRSTF